MVQVGEGASPSVRRVARAGVPVVLMAVLGPWSATSAWAHDPGQGVEVAPVHLRAVRAGNVIELTVAGDRCDGWSPARVVARRSGRERVGLLEETMPCTFVGDVEVDDPGRWFVYAEIAVEGQPTEAWIPVEQEGHDKRTELYLTADEGPRGAQVIAGVLLYGVVFAIFAAVVVALRRVDHPFWDQPVVDFAVAGPASSPRKV
jgi:hypothetical protein